MSDTNNDADSARRLRELFRGRLDQETALGLLKDFGGELQAVDFLLNEKEDVVQQYLKESPSYVRNLTSDAKKLDEVLEHGIEFTVRQFACGQCVRSWWKKVPARKEISKCFRCKTKFEPVPKENEWGWAKFNCLCGNEFHGHGEMNVTTSVCYQCRQPVPVEKILPPRRRIGQRKSRTPHSCNGVNCYNRSGDSNQFIHMGPLGGVHYSHGANIVNNLCTTGPTGAGMDPHGPGVPAPGSVPKFAQPGGAAAGSLPRNKGRSPPGKAGTSAPGAYPGPGRQPVCCHPKSPKPTGNYIRTASRKHTSTGSSVTTFLSQGSLDVRSDAVPRIPPTIPE